MCICITKSPCCAPETVNYTSIKCTYIYIYIYILKKNKHSKTRQGSLISTEEFLNDQIQK